MRALMYFFAAVFAVLGLTVAVLGLSSISAFAGFGGAILFGLLGYVAEA